jgi:hypothetical protein
MVTDLSEEEVSGAGSEEETEWEVMADLRRE